MLLFGAIEPSPAIEAGASESACVGVVPWTPMEACGRYSYPAGFEPAYGCHFAIAGSQVPFRMLLGKKIPAGWDDLKLFAQGRGLHLIFRKKGLTLQGEESLAMELRAGRRGNCVGSWQWH